MNMAVDESISELVLSNSSDPTIRFYSWEPSAVSIGCFQSMTREVDVNECCRLGIDVVRRITGGGAVFHDHSGEVTYSIIVPEHKVSRDINHEYRAVCARIVEALAHLGIEAEFHPINDVLVHGRKISGSAQTRRKGVFLQHGTILYQLDAERMFSVLRVSSMKTSDKSISQPKDRVTCIRNHSKATMDELLSALEGSFTRGLDFYESDLTKRELEVARELARKKYSNASWNESR